MEVKFYDTVNDELLKFAVIISQSNGKWVFCKDKERDTYEVPVGHRETGENILETAKRELQEETGAVKYEIKPICVYTVTGKTRVNDTAYNRKKEKQRIGVEFRNGFDADFLRSLVLLIHFRTSERSE